MIPGECDTSIMTTCIGFGWKALDADKLQYYAETGREIIEFKEGILEEPVVHSLECTHRL